MKRILIVLLCCFLSFYLTGCEEAKEEEEKASTTQEEKINLNDNLYYYTNIELTNKDCGGFGFPTNAESILDENWFSSYEGLKYVDKIELFSHDDIVYDEEKENAAKEEWDKLRQPERGVAEFSLGYDKHEFYFGYWYIHLVKDEEGNEFSEEDQYYELANTLSQEIESFKESAYSIIKEKEGYRFRGTCGGPAYEISLLDEATCDKYNLNCARW